MISKMKRLQILLAFALVLLLAACAADEDSGVASDMAETTAAPAMADGGGEAEAPQEAGDETTDGFGESDRDGSLGNGGVDDVALPANLGREIIYTADMTVAVTDVAAASTEATRIIEEMGGYLFGQESVGAPEPRSVLTFKVLPGDFQQALARLGAVGEIRTQNISADDVTERVVDLESRIATAETSVERLKGFLAEAEDIETIAELENQLLQRETDLETMRGQLRTLRDRIDLATIYLTLTEALSNPAISVDVTGFPGHDGGISCPGDGGISAVEGAEATVCFEIVNTGDTPLAGFELKDTVLDVELGDLIVVWGDPQDVLEPGQSLVLAYETTVERSLRTQTRVSAEPVDQEGNRVAGREVAATSVMGVTAEDPGGLPGFQDGLEASWSALQWTGGVIVLFAGAVLPFIVPLAILAALGLWIARRRGPREPSEQPVTPPWTAETSEDAGAEDSDAEGTVGNTM